MNEMTRSDSQKRRQTSGEMEFSNRLFILRAERAEIKIERNLDEIRSAWLHLVG
jgi:hypothetical protein